jgi:hypothetical protein
MDGFSNQAQFNHAADLVNDWNKVKANLDEVQSLIRGLAFDGHISEQDAKTINGSLDDWRTDSESDIDLKDYENALRDWEDR